MLQVLVYGSQEFIPEYPMITLEEFKKIVKIVSKGSYLIFLGSVKQLYNLSYLLKNRKINVVVPISVKYFNKRWKKTARDLKIRIIYKRDLRDFTNLTKDERLQYLDKEGVEWTVSKLLTNPRNIFKISNDDIKQKYWFEKYLEYVKLAPSMRK